jgi:subtilisin family serine protease
MIKSFAKSLAGLSLGLLVMGCSTTAVITAPPIVYGNVSPRISDLSKSEKQRWGHLDLVQDTVPGMSVDRAYSELLKKRKGETVIVAVIDSGIDLNHEDIKEVLWVNPGEIAGDEGFAAEQRFVVKENAVTSKHIITFTIIFGNPIGINLSNTVRRTRVKWCGLFLRNFLKQ